MNTLNFSKLADVLYHIRCAGASRPSGIIKTHLNYAHGACLELLETLGLRPNGDSANDADLLKLDLMKVETGKPPEVPMSRRDLSPVEAALDTASEVNGSGDMFRELGRFQEFCMRARFHGFIKDDPMLPVRPWIEARGHTSLVDLREAADLYVQWAREANRIFLASRQGDARTP